VRSSSLLLSGLFREFGKSRVARRSVFSIPVSAQKALVRPLSAVRDALCPATVARSPHSRTAPSGPPYRDRALASRPPRSLGAFARSSMGRRSDSLRSSAATSLLSLASLARTSRVTRASLARRNEAAPGRYVRGPRSREQSGHTPDRAGRRGESPAVGESRRRSGSRGGAGLAACENRGAIFGQPRERRSLGGLEGRGRRAADPSGCPRAEPEGQRRFPPRCRRDAKRLSLRGRPAFADASTVPDSPPAS
jgi:hypothetical protein